MKVAIEHPRISRGAAVTKSKGEKDQESAMRSKIRRQVLQERRQVLQEIEGRDMKGQEIEGYGPLISERARVESKFLAPKPKNFVLTDDVKKYLDRSLLWLKAKCPVHLIGPTGCGKTALALYLAEKMGKPFVWINGDEELTTHELIGGYSRIEMRSLRDKYIHNVYKSTDVVEPQWVNNPLALACQNGYTLIYNEFSRSKPEANNVLLSILEEGVLELPTKFGEERYIKVHPEFNLILTSNNIEYAGIHKPQDALLDRIPAVYMDYYDEGTEVEIVKAHSRLPDKDTKKVVSVVRFLRENLDAAEKPSTRSAIMIANGVRVANGLNKDMFEQLCIDAIASKSADQKDLSKKKALIVQAIRRA